MTLVVLIARRASPASASLARRSTSSSASASAAEPLTPAARQSCRARLRAPVLADTSTGCACGEDDSLAHPRRNAGMWIGLTPIMN